MDKASLVLIFFLTLRGPSQKGQNPQTAQCKFSDGNKITATYSPERRSYRLSTNEPLITAGGITVPAGEYTVGITLPSGDYIRSWEQGHFLVLQKTTEAGESSKLPDIPLSASTSSEPQKKGPLSFVSTGGSCTMQLASTKSNTLFSVEFTEKNTDMPVVP